MPFEGTLPSPGYLAPKSKNIGRLTDEEAARVRHFLILTNSTETTARFTGISVPAVRRIKKSLEQASLEVTPVEPIEEKAILIEEPKREGKNSENKTSRAGVRAELLQLQRDGIIPSLGFIAQKK